MSKPLLSIEAFREYCVDRHDNYCNQKYGSTLPYSYHLMMVMRVFERFNNKLTHLTDDDRNLLNYSLPGHDLLEDTRLTYGKLQELIPGEALKAIYLCTQYRGRNADERYPIAYYRDIARNKIALVTKLCDMIANVEHGLETGSNKPRKYKERYYFKIKAIFHDHPEVQCLIAHLEELFTKVKEEEK
jgi:hypothetical protein